MAIVGTIGFVGLVFNDAIVGLATTREDEQTCRGVAPVVSDVVVGSSCPSWPHRSSLSPVLSQTREEREKAECRQQDEEIDGAVVKTGALPAGDESWLRRSDTESDRDVRVAGLNGRGGDRDDRQSY